MGVGVMASAVVIASGVSDNFDRANSGSLGANWTHDAGAFTIVSNKAHRQSTGGDYAVFNTLIGSTDMYVEADAGDTNSTYVVINGRTTIAAPAANVYLGYIVPASTAVKIGKNVGGGFSEIATGAIPANLGAHHLRLELQGSAQRLYVDGVLRASAADTSVTTGTAAGFNIALGSLGTIDNWQAGAL